MEGIELIHKLVLLHRESFKIDSKGIELLPSAFLLLIRGLRLTCSIRM
jgi:hypothetical protein